MKKQIKVKEKTGKLKEPIKYVLVCTPRHSDYMSFFTGDTFALASDLKAVMRYVKENSDSKFIRVFEVSEELKMRTRVELDL